MPDIPTPFIGGSESPRGGETAGRRELAPPFYPQVPAEGVEPAASSEVHRGTPASKASHTSREPETQAPELEEVIRIEIVEEEEEPGTFEQVPLAAKEPARSIPVDAVGDTAGPSQAAELEFPEFLLGPDGGTEKAVTAEGEEAHEAPRERLAQVADELKRGTLGARIRALIADLRSADAAAAVERAFAAGYLAAKEEEEAR